MMIVLDQERIDEILAERRALGIRTNEEVWDGVTYLMPDPNNEHQDLAGDFLVIFKLLFCFGTENRAEATPNLSDRVRGWKKNYRNPDMAYFPADSLAVDCKTHWCGGPDFLLEIVSPNDKCRDKLRFYASIGTKEVLILDRDPWKLELYQLSKGRLRLTGMARPGHTKLLESRVVPLTFQLLRSRPRPKIRIKHTESDQEWTF